MSYPRRRSLIAALAAAALVVTALGGVNAATADPLAIEGEAYASTNMTPGAAAQASASGGSSLQLYTATAAPSGGYVATYDVTAPEAGLYRLEATTIPVNVAWASPFSFRANSDPWQGTSGARQLAVVSSELRTYDLGAVALNAGANTVSFQVTQRRTAPNTNYALFLDAFTLTPVDVVVASVVAPDRFGVYEEGESATLRASLNAAMPAPVDVEWSVIDYHDQPIASGTSTVPAGTGAVDIPLGSALATGAYRVSAWVAGSGAPTAGSFAVLPAAASRPAVADSPFAVDVYGSKLIATDDAEAFARVLRLTGVDWIRDRQRWNDVINPSAGTIDFSGEQQPQAWLEAADAEGLRTMSSFHDGPSWTRNSTRELPQDLRDMYAFALAAGEHYDGLVDAWQLWNEQNRGFALTAEGADRYAAVMKAAALGFLDSGTDAQLIGGGLAGVDPHYAQWQFRNGILDYLDAYAYHTHTTVNASATVTEHPDFSSQLDAAAPYGGASKGRWVSEAGIALNNSDVTKLPTDAQERLQARYIVSSAAQSLAEGSTKHFFFIAAPYREGAAYWSMYRSPDQPMAALAAQSVMTEQLGEGAYLGHVPNLGADTAAYVFDSGSAEVAVLWAPTPTTVQVGVQGATASVSDLMGVSQSATVSGGTATVQIGPDPVYLTASAITGVLDAPPAVTPAAPVTAAQYSDAERVVVQAVFDDATSANSQQYGYGLVTNAATALTAEVYNFNDHAVTAAVGATAEGGWQVAGASSVTIPAGGRSTVALSVTAGANLRQSIADLTLTATVGGEPSSPTVVELRPRTSSLTAVHAIDGADDIVRATYTNRTATAQSVTGASWSFDGATPLATPLTQTVAAGASITIDSPAVPTTGESIDVETAVTVSGVGVASVRTVLSALDRADVAFVPEVTIDVDGTRDAALAAHPAITLAEPGVDPASLAARAWFTWDADNVYLTAEVTDDIHVQPYTGNATWQADGLQFAIAPNWPGETALRPEIQPRIEFGFARTSAGPQLYRYQSGSVAGFLVSGADIAAVRNDTTGVTTYEAAIPWTLLSPIAVGPASAASLSLTANDGDGDGTRGWVQWGGGITTAKDSELFEPVVFAPATGSRDRG